MAGHKGTGHIGKCVKSLWDSRMDTNPEGLGMKGRHCPLFPLLTSLSAVMVDTAPTWGLLPFPREHRKGEAGDRFLLLGALHSDFSGGRGVYASCDMPLCEVGPSHGDFFHPSL